MPRLRLPLAVLAATLALAAPASADLPAGSFVFNGGITALTPHAGAYYAAGPFSFVQRATGGALSTSPATALTPGEVDHGFPQVVGTVEAIVADGSGGWYLGGSFSFVGGKPRANFAHVLGDGTVDDTIDVAFSGPVKALAVAGGRLFVGGDFVHPVGGGSQRALVALQDGVVDPAFTPDIQTTGAFVNTLTLSGGALYAGGFFEQLGAGGDLVSRTSLARLSPATGVADSWAMTPSPAVGIVSAVTVSGATAYVGGSFEFAGGPTPYRNLAAFATADGARVATFDPAVDSAVDDIAVAAGRVFAAGQFFSVGGTTRRYFAAIDPADGALDTTWPSIPSNASSADALAVDGDTLYVGGDFQFLGTSGPRLAAVKLSDKTVRTTFRPEPSGTVRAIVPGATLVAGGRFAGAGLPVAYPAGMVRLNADGSLDTDWSPDLGNAGSAPQVTALQSTPAGLYVGGIFDEIRGSARANLARLDAAGDVDPSFTTPTDGQVRAFAPDGDRLLLGGSFTQVGGQSRPRLAALTAAGTTDLTFAPAVGSGGDSVSGLSVAAGRAYVWGSFTTVGGQSRPHGFAAVDSGTGAVTAFAPLLRSGFGTPITPGLVNDVEAASDRVHVAGNFGQVGTTDRAGIAALDPDSGALLTDFDAGFAPLANSLVYGLLRTGSTLYAGGGWDVPIGGAPRDGLAALDPVTGAAQSFAPRIVRDLFSGMQTMTASADLVVAAGFVAGARGAYGPTVGGLQLFDLVAPTVTVTTPAVDAVFVQGSSVPSSFACDDLPAFTPDPVCTGPATVDTTTVGDATFTVTATDAQGTVTTREVPYTVVAPEPTPTPTPGPTATPEPSPSPAATAIPAPPSPSPTATPSPAPKPNPAASAGVISRVTAARVSRTGRVKLTLTCTGGRPCSGGLRLTARVRRGTRTRTVTVLPSTRFTVAAGRRRTLTVRLGATGRTLLRAPGARTRATVVVSPSTAARRGLTLTLRR